ncbi:MAG: TetR/AcrR family transcriptional regulator [Acidimicrobiales bacterium]|nr:TetR/AcrR family transcriptional regulator [Acidimicrobiales bacterium]
MSTPTTRSPATATDDGAVETTSVDGRTARRDRNRDAVLDAVIELFTEGQVELVAADVAERSGVSLRSVYRYFDDLEALARAAIARQTERFAPLAALADDRSGTLDERIDRIVDVRLRLYEAVGATRRAAIQRAASNPILADQLERTRVLLDRQVEALFAPELDALDPKVRATVAPALDLLLTFESYDQLRRTRRLSGAETRRVLRATLARLLT